MHGKTHAFNRRIPVIADDIEVKLIRTGKAVRANVIRVGNDILHIPFYRFTGAADPDLALICVVTDRVRRIHVDIAHLCAVSAGGAVRTVDPVAQRQPPDDPVFACPFFVPCVDRLHDVVRVVLIDSDIHIDMLDVIAVAVRKDRLLQLRKTAGKAQKNCQRKHCCHSPMDASARCSSSYPHLVFQCPLL